MIEQLFGVANVAAAAWFALVAAIAIWNAVSPSAGSLPA
jgi:hypothetical protein